MPKVFFLLAALSGSVALGAPSGGVFNVRDYGASPDGRTKDTAAIARAVAACAAAGGGTVWFPAGRYLTGSIQLESNLTLQLDAGAELLYSPDPADSPLVPSRWEGTNVWIHAPLIYANGKENIAIVGRGTINGQGENWWWRAGHDPRRAAEARPAQEAWLRLLDQIEAGRKTTAADFTLAAEYLRPVLIEANGCRNVLVDGVTIADSPFWLLHPVYSQNVVVHGVTFVSRGLNGDGCDVDSCRNVRISDCFFSTGDDCVVLKAGKGADGRRVALPTECVTVTNCVMSQGHGAIVIGSETAGGVRDITASNIVCQGTWSGIRIKSLRGCGGVIENVRCDNFVIEDAPHEAVVITALYSIAMTDPASERACVFRNLAFSHLTIVHARQVASIEGLPQSAIDQVRFSDVVGSGQEGFVCDHATNVELHAVRVDAASGGAFRFDSVRGLVLDDVGAREVQPGTPVIRFADSDDIWLRSSQAAPGTGTFVQIDGAKPARFRLTGNDLSSAAQPIAPASTPVLGRP